MNNHALTVVIRRWQLREPVSCFKYISILWPLSWDGGIWRSKLYTWVNITNFWRCHEMMATDKEWLILDRVSSYSDRCHLTMKTDRKFHTLGMYNQALTMTTDGAYLILEGVSSWCYMYPKSYMSLGDDNWQSILHIFWMNNHALSFIMRRWKLMEHASYLRNTLPFSDRCYETMITDGACFMTEKYIAIPWPLLSDHANWQSMFHTWGRITMLWAVSWDDDNWQSILHILVINNHALSVVMRRR